MKKNIFFIFALALSACGEIGLEGQVLISTETATPSPAVVVVTATALPTATAPPPTASPAPKASAMPQAATYPVADEIWSSDSPDSQWRVEGEYAPDGQGTDNIRLTLKRADNSAQWLMVDRHDPGGLGQYFPKYFYWSPGGRYLYFANESISDGCALFTARQDLYRVDLQAKTPTLETVLPTDSYAWAVALSPDEKSVAYLASADGRWVNGQLNVKNILSRQVVTEKVAGEATVAWGLIWSPDGTQIALTQASAANGCDLASTSLVQFDASTIKESRILLSEDTRALETIAWGEDNTLTLRDRAGGVWHFDLGTGVLTQP